MNIKHNELVINPDNPFESCKLDRKKYAEVLTTIIGNYSDGFVLAVNNEWGTGKTTFIKMWEQHLKKQTFRTIYFNAWENDFELNPVAAILAELKKLFPSESDKGFKKLLNAGAVISKNVIPSVVKALVKRYMDVDELTEGVEGALKSGFEILNDEVNDYVKKQKGITEFRTALEELVKHKDDKKPLIFIIDELDRCRPNYAVEVLEQMKHYFSVTGIVYVLSIDKIQLGNAVKGVYGNDNIDSNEYLRRFIDIEYSLPDPPIDKYCNYLFEYYNFSEFFNNITRIHPELTSDGAAFTKFSNFFFVGKNLRLRQIDKIFAHARLALMSFNYMEYVFPNAFIVLIYLYHHDKKMYDKIKSRQLNLVDFFKEINGVFPVDINKDKRWLKIQVESLLLLLYFNYYRDLNREAKLIEKNIETNVMTLAITLVDRSDEDRYDITNKLIAFERSDYEHASIEFLLNRISLFENVNI